MYLFTHVTCVYVYLPLLIKFSFFIEPPQGYLKQVLPKDETNLTCLKISNSRWQLSEDPEDRKDGLWIWGLFEEPLYPFMLLQIETEEYILPKVNIMDSNEKEDGDAILPLKLYAQINHKRDKKTGQVELDAATLNIREFESVKGSYICTLIMLHKSSFLTIQIM